MIELLGEALLANGYLFLPTWLLATYLKKVSLVDLIWGPSYAVTLTVALLRNEQLLLPQALLSLLIYLWAFRLALHLLPRAIHHGEDRRYTAMRQGRSKGFFVVWSLVSIFGLQVLLSLALSVPFLFAVESSSDGSWLAYVGLGIAVFGLLYETIADQQLRRFLAERDNAQSVCNRGLWRFSRHPNYFGEFVFWWGVWLCTISLGAPIWSVYAPLGLTFLLLRVSGITLMESTIPQRRPEYLAYSRTTNAFFPGPTRPNHD